MISCMPKFPFSRIRIFRNNLQLSANLKKHMRARRGGEEACLTFKAIESISVRKILGIM